MRCKGCGVKGLKTSPYCSKECHDKFEKEVEDDSEDLVEGIQEWTERDTKEESE